MKGATCDRKKRVSGTWDFYEPGERSKRGDYPGEATMPLLPVSPGPALRNGDQFDLQGPWDVGYENMLF